MAVVRKRGEEVRQYILENVEAYPDSIASKAAEHFSVSRQAIYKHIKKLVDQKSLIKEETSRKNVYKLYQESPIYKEYELTPELEEDVIWTNDVVPYLVGLPDNVVEIWNYGFNEMFNNAIDHSGGTEICTFLKKGPLSTSIVISDDGEGIFRKIQRELSLLDESHAVLELSKGKLTTDPKNHSGQGIFFSSRMFDLFLIASGNVIFSHTYDTAEDWISKASSDKQGGTTVVMELKSNTARDMKKIFDQYSSSVDEGYGFTKTVVPVHLAQYGDDYLVSRSQAKRLLARVEKFKVVILDFKGVDTIGQAFADQIFRVFVNSHPEIELFAVHVKDEVKKMILRAGGDIRD